MKLQTRLLDAHQVRDEHRRMRHRLGPLHRLALRLPSADESDVRRDIVRVVRFLDNDVLAHASAEELVLQTSPSRGDDLARARLVAYHDSIRLIRGLLADSGDALRVRMQAKRMAGLLLSLHGLLTAHLADEVDTYLPLLADSREPAAPGHSERSFRERTRLLVPTSAFQ